MFQVHSMSHEIKMFQDVYSLEKQWLNKYDTHRTISKNP